MNPEHVRVLVAWRMQQATEALEDGRYLRTFYATLWVCIQTGDDPEPELRSSAPSCDRSGMWVAPLDAGPGPQMEHLLIDTRHAVRRLYDQFREQLCEESHRANPTHTGRFACPRSGQR